MMETQQLGRTAVLRRFEPRDYPGAVAVVNAVFPDRQDTVEEWRYDDEHFDPKCLHERYVAEDAGSGDVVGAGSIWNAPWAYHPRKFVADIRVAPRHQRRGIGTALWERLEERLRELRSISVKTQVWEAMPDGVRFATRLGFRETMRAWESRLPVAAFDFERFAPYVDLARQQGVTITTLAAEQAKDEANLARIHALEAEIAQYIPRPADDVPTAFSYAFWLEQTVQAPWAIHDAFFLAAVDGEYAGLSSLFKPQAGDYLHQGLTGMRPSFRGRHIATALKVKTVEYARDHGVPEIRTWNEINNAPMLAINVKLGFVRQPAWITFIKEF